MNNASRTIHRIIGLAAVCALASGCSAVNMYKSAHTLGKGQTEVLAAPQSHAAGGQDSFKVPFPELAVSVRHGVRDDVDVSGTFTALPLGDVLTSYGLEAAARMHLYRSPGGRFDIAAGVGAGYRTVESSGAVFEAVNANLPVTFGFNFGDDELAISPTLYWQRWYSMGANPVDYPAAGVSLGYRWQFSRRYALLPEVGWAYSPTDGNSAAETVMLHAGVALVRSFGRSR